jgi:hypothetical protein
MERYNIDSSSSGYGNSWLDIEKDKDCKWIMYKDVLKLERDLKALQNVNKQLCDHIDALNKNIPKGLFCNELRNAFIKVKVVSDGDGNNYIIPNNRQEEFEINLTDTDFIDSGKFDNKWKQFSTGGCVNNKQLYTIITDI